MNCIACDSGSGGVATEKGIAKGTIGPFGHDPQNRLLLPKHEKALLKPGKELIFGNGCKKVGKFWNCFANGNPQNGLIVEHGFIGLVFALLFLAPI